MPDYTRLLAVARRAVADACAVTRQVQHSLDEVRAITKDDKSPVTVADFAAQAIVGAALRDAFGDGAILVGEEASQFLREEGHEPHLKATLMAVQEIYPDADEAFVLRSIDVGAGDTHHAGFWTLDPVDGTKGFLRGQQYAIALAYIERGVPVVGVLGCPNLPADFSAPLDRADAHGCIYFSIAGDGVYEVPADDPDARPVQIRRPDPDPAEPISVCASVETAHSNVDDTDRVMQLVGSQREPTRLDSQAKYAVVARGQADAYLRLPTKKDYVERIWDHAAGSLIATQTGCAVTDILGHPLDFSHGRGLEKNKGIVCAPPSVHRRIIAAIDQLAIGR